MSEVFINRIATANPPHDVHAAFLDFGRLMLREDKRRLALFNRMADRSAIAHRYSYFQPIGQSVGEGHAVDAEGFYRLGKFPGTAERMRKFESVAPGLAVEAVEKLLPERERDLLASYVMYLSVRGQVEFDTLAAHLGGPAAADPPAATRVRSVLKEWEKAAAASSVPPPEEARRIRSWVVAV